MICRSMSRFLAASRAFEYTCSRSNFALSGLVPAATAAAVATSTSVTPTGPGVLERERHIVPPSIQVSPTRVLHSGPPMSDSCQVTINLVLTDLASLHRHVARRLNINVPAAVEGDVLAFDRDRTVLLHRNG